MEDLATAFVGSWDVLQATLPNGQNAYTGTIIVKRNRNTFDLDWEITAGQYVGVGLSIDNHVFVSCGEQRAGLGIALFHVQPDSQILIQWGTPELQGTIGRGEFISRFTGSFEGEHRLRYHLPDGSFHGEWNVRIQKSGSLFEIIWQKGNTVHFTGLGLATANGLAVGWYPDLSQLAFLDYVLDPDDKNRILATWILGGFSTLGTETLKRI